MAWAIAKVGVDGVMTLLTKKLADEIGKSADNLDRVDEVHAHSDDLASSRSNAGQVNDLNSVSKETPNIKDHDGVQAKQNIMERMDEIGPRSDDIIEEAIESGNIPDRAQNRINIRAGSATLSKKYNGSGISQNKIKYLLILLSKIKADNLVQKLCCYLKRCRAIAVQPFLHLLACQV